MVEPFPSDWRLAVCLVPHPDDPEYAAAAAVAKWTSAGKHVRYVFACRGEAGIPGMSHEQTGRVREAEQRRAAEIVGVSDLDFWDFPDSNICDGPELRQKIVDTLTELNPDVVLTIYGGPEWAPGMPNQPDHREFAAAVIAAYDSLDAPPRWLFWNEPGGGYVETVDEFIDVAVDALAAHEKYLAVLDPAVGVVEQARRVVNMTTPARDDCQGRRAVGFTLVRSCAAAINNLVFNKQA
ncbi:MAG: PIG-L family deacetylase [Mycobacteriaceae bacterium]|nr:PIG-L family deacetylase [Mycobacteriaceae bacterium]